MSRAFPLNSKVRGFTLLELMLSMTLTALLLGMLSAGVYAVVNDWQRETAPLDETLDRTLVVLQVERALIAAFPHTYVDPERLSRYVWFEGAEDSLGFVSAVSPQRRMGLTAWRLVSDEEEGLLLTLTPAFADNPGERLDEATAIPLLPGYRASFRYLSQSGIEEKEWLEEWIGSERQSLPLAVHVVLTPLEADANLPELDIVAPIRTWRHVEIDPIVPVN